MQQTEKLNPKPTLPLQDLTKRETEIMKLICQEYSSDKIAKRIGISAETIKVYRRNIFKKIGVRNVVGMVLYAVRHGIYKTVLLPEPILVPVKISSKQKPKPYLTKKELALTLLICKGYLNKEIAKKMQLSIRTIEGQREIVYQKLKVRNTASLIVFSIKYGIYKI